MPSLAELDQMTHEWTAWRIICQELERLNIDINQQERLHAALVRWGEEMAELRDYQDSNDRTRWLEERRQNAFGLGLALNE